MKKLKKMMALVIAMVMMFTMSATAFAANITVKPPVNTDDNATNTYTIYRVFDATVAGNNSSAVSYTLPEGVSEAPVGFEVVNGNVQLERVDGNLNSLTQGEINNIIDYVALNSTTLDKHEIQTTGEEPVTFEDLEPGYYYITTTTGTLVVVTSNNVTVTVEDKNTVPTLTKEITDASGNIVAGKNAIGQVGTTVSFESVITVGKGMSSYKFYDTMSDGLELDSGSIDVTYSETPDDYIEADPIINGNTININFNDGLNEGTTITITYDAKITNEALTTIPETNTAYLEYGNGPTVAKTPEEITNVYSAKVGVNKVDGNGSPLDETDDIPLAGAKFKLYKFDTDGTTKLYYNYNATQKTIAWDQNTGDERETNEYGKISEFVGLNDGTYYLEESYTPDGYNTAADTMIVINGKDYNVDNLEQEAYIVNNKGSLLPSTGGMGTTILYIIGGILVIGAGVLLITKRRMVNE